MIKKKRSAKQLVNDKRLGRMAKARHAAKKKTKKKAVSYTVGGKKYKTGRKSNQRKSSKKSHLWFVFKCLGNSLVYLTSNGKTSSYTNKRANAILWKTKGQAEKAARYMAKRPRAKMYIIGIAPDNMTAAQIRAKCNPKK